MKDDILKGKWKEIKGGIKQKWAKLTDDDLLHAEGSRDKLIGALQKRYGYTKDQAEKEYDQHMGQYSDEGEFVGERRRREAV